MSLRSTSTAISFCLAGGLLGSTSTAISFCLAGALLGSTSTAISFCLAGGLLGSTSTAISFCLKAARAGAAVAPPLHPGYPANTTARRRRVPSSVHISSRTARDSLPAQRSLVPPSMAGHPKMFTSSAVVMPPQSQNPGQNLKE